MAYSYKKTLKKTLFNLALFIFPVLIDTFIGKYPEYMQLTLGGALVALKDYLKHGVGLKLP